MIVHRDEYTIIVNATKGVVVIDWPQGGENVDLTDIDGPYNFFEPHERVLHRIWCYGLARERTDQNI